MFCVGLKTVSQNLVKNAMNMSARLSTSEYYSEKKMMHLICLKWRKSIDVFMFLVTHSSYNESVRPLYLVRLFYFFFTLKMLVPTSFNSLSTDACHIKDQLMTLAADVVSLKADCEHSPLFYVNPHRSS